MSYTQSDIRTLFTANGESIESISTVTTGREPVFHVSLPEGSKYAKVINQDRIARYEDLLSQEVDIGWPDCQLIGQSPQVLLMDPACGRTLSSQLMISCLPGVWNRRSASLQKVCRTLARYLARLHESTLQKTKRVADDPWRTVDDLQLPDALRNRLSRETVSRIQETFDAVRSRTVAYSCLHGDLTPHNIYCNDEAVDVIDFNLPVSIAVEDCVIFHCGLELMIGRLLYGRTSQFEVLIDAFWEEYRAATSTVSAGREVVVPLIIGRYCSLFSSYQGETSGWRANVTRITDPRLIERNVRRYVSEL